MDKKKREKSNLILLLFIIFAGINYSMFSFVIQPIMLEKENLQQDLKTKAYALSQKDIDAENLISLKEELTELSLYEEEFDDKVSDELDTVKTSVEFYNYINKKHGKGISVTYDLTDVMAGIEARIEADNNQEIYETITDPADPNYDPYIDPNNDLYDQSMDPNYQSEGLMVDNLINQEEKKLYRTALIGLSVEIDKNHLFSFLQEFESSLSRYFTVSKIDISSQNSNDEQTQETTTSDGVTELDMTDANNTLTLDIELRTYVKDGVKVEDAVIDYDFYHGLNAYPQLEDMFK